MDLVVGDIVSGKVTGITKFGAFVTVESGKSGLVHISEIANSYVSDVNTHLTTGQEVMVKVLSIDEGGRINLSIKAAAPKPAAQSSLQRPFQRNADRGSAQRMPPRQLNREQGPVAEASFEDRLKKFMQDSDSKMSDSRQFSDKKSSRRRGGK